MEIEYTCKECAEVTLIPEFMTVGYCPHCRGGELEEVEDPQTWLCIKCGRRVKAVGSDGRCGRCAPNAGF